ncbi:RND efflux system, outer membrane lipoprotein, NodT family [Tolumonas auensis DSM 9187]|uniref:RND efflux system, outer membrane lipoprotein, NodT family n=1 Tax=Tolumonas auensis (strain DSM 9187 / NBRC 110442 / TA 4) TaxID=595494 RepID=C4LCU4_TOLAT|nr:efflux transporter outer membrane subunit [Tolumonas auensis]ACQ92658.1 RND efflux system, outer membrane lipoprotein, NodT family [Tolumonas auensis DSM 9187]
MKIQHASRLLSVESWRQFSLLPISVLVLSACAQAPDQNLAAPKQAAAYASANSFDVGNKVSWPENKWWLRYNDAQLNALVDEAIHDSPSLKAAAARLKSAEGLAQQAGASRYIQAGMALSASESKVSYQYQAYAPPKNWNDYGSATLNFSYDFDFWGKNKAAVAAATSDFAAAQAESATANLMISTSLVQSYAELARLYANRDTAVTALDIRKKTVSLLQQRFSNGLETQGAVRQAEALRANAEAELLSIDESIALQKNALAALLGKGPDRGLSIARPGVKLQQSFGLPKEAGVGLLGHRPDVTASRWRAESAAKRIGIAKAQFYPDVSLSAFIGYQAFGLDNLTRSGNDAGSIGPALYLPLFTGGRLQGQLTTAEASYEEAVANYNNTVTQAFHDVADVVTSSKALTARLQKTQEAVDAAQDAYQIANNRYRGGLATYLDVLTAEDALLGSQRALVNLQSRSFSLDVALVHALGGGYQAPRS